MSNRRQDLSLMLTGGLFFAVVAPYAGAIVPVFPMMLFASLGFDRPLVTLLLPLAFGGPPALVSGILYVLLGSDIARDKQRPVDRLYWLGSALCVCFFILWVILFRFMRERGIESIAGLGATLFIALLLSIFAGIGGYLASMAFHRFIRRLGLWQQTDIGARLIENGNVKS